MLNEEIKAILKNVDGKWGVLVKSLNDGKRLFELNPDEWFPAASIGKVGIALFVFDQFEKNLASAKERIEFSSEMRMKGSGILQILDSGLNLSLLDVVKLMLIVSDNSCAKILIKKFTPQRINEYLRGINLETTQLKIDGEEYGFGLTTANEISTMFEGIYSGNYLNKEYSSALIEIMKKCDSEMGIRRFLPNDPYASEDNLEIANKGGSIPGVRSDVGIVFTQKPYVIAILSKDVSDKSNKPDNQGRLAVAKISEAVYRSLK